MNAPVNRRPLALDSLRTFEAVARRLSFSAAAQELFLTQSAISRQIKGLEDALGASLFNRGTRRVELSAAGEVLRQALLPALDRIDRAVHQIRVAQGRRQVNLSTFASFASLWLMPRLAAFAQTHPDIDIRISAGDQMADLDDPELDLVLRYGFDDVVPPGAGAERMFGERLTPVVSPWLLAQARAGQVPPLGEAAHLAQHALLEEDDHRPSATYLGWRRWLQQAGQPALEPRRWIYLNYTHQQIQGALAGQGVALARMALVHEHLTRGELVEPFGPRGPHRQPRQLLAAAPARRAPDARAAGFPGLGAGRGAAHRAGFGSLTRANMGDALPASPPCRIGNPTQAAGA